MKQEFYYIRKYFIDLNKNEMESAFDILVILKDDNNTILRSTTIDKINSKILENLIGKDYQTILIN